MLEIKLKEISVRSPVHSEYEAVVDGKIIGRAQLRHKPSKSNIMPEGFENHIFYEIKPEFRNKGYATETLRLLLKEAKKLGLNEVIITIASDNVPSQKVAEANGAILVDEKPAKDGTIYRKYKVNL
jgi:predicted acetyltransferase